MATETTWEAFSDYVQKLAIANNTGYIVYEHHGIAGYISYAELKKRQGNYPGTMLAEVLAPVVIKELGPELLAFIKLPVGVESIRSDKYIMTDMMGSAAIAAKGE